MWPKIRVNMANMVNMINWISLKLLTSIFPKNVHKNAAGVWVERKMKSRLKRPDGPRARSWAPEGPQDFWGNYKVFFSFRRFLRQGKYAINVSNCYRNITMIKLKIERKNMRQIEIWGNVKCCFKYISKSMSRAFSFIQLDSIIWNSNYITGISGH